jgi:type II secretory pathway component PulF
LNDKYNDAIEEVKKSSKQILTFSHFVPRWMLTASHLLFMVWYFQKFSNLVDSYYAWLNYLSHYNLSAQALNLDINHNCAVNMFCRQLSYLTYVISSRSVDLFLH